MVVGQGVLGGDDPRVERVAARLEAAEAARHAAHAGVLADLVELAGLLGEADGEPLATVAEVALRWRCSEARAGELLEQGRLLSALPGGLEALRSGVLTVEQTGVLLRETAGLADAVVLAVWARLLVVLRADVARGVVRPPARLRELLRRLVVSVDPAGAEARRRQAAQDGRVDYRKREDGLVDLFALGLSGPNARAVLSRIAACSRPVGPHDERSADRRRLDAFVDLLLGRDRPLAAPALCDAAAAPDRVRGRGCGCGVGAQVPCGADVQVLVPLGAALGSTDELAEQVGHGPLDPALLAELLLAAPRLRAVHVDTDGVPVSVAARTLTPARHDPLSLRETLLRLAATAPGPWHPRHPDDHPPDHLADEQHNGAGGEGTGRARPGAATPGDASSGDASSGDAGSGGAPLVGAPPGSGPPDSPPPGALLARGRPRPAAERARGPHPDGLPGRYRISAGLRRLVMARSPRCEWPGCGARAGCCDLDHDLAWPEGPTCACNLGALCRHHHRVKQTGWTKTRSALGVRWTSPTGRSWHSPHPATPPARPTRPLPALPAVPDPAAAETRAGPGELAEDDWYRALADPAVHDLDLPDPVADDVDPDLGEPEDDLGRRLTGRLTTWTLDLADHTAWEPAAA